MLIDEKKFDVAVLPTIRRSVGCPSTYRRPAGDERGQDRLVRDVEEHGETSRHEHDDDELRVAQPVDRVGDRNRRARPRSAVINTGRRGRRSTIAPAGRPNSTNGENSTAVSAPTSNVVACSTEIATRAERAG